MNCLSYLPHFSAYKKRGDFFKVILTMKIHFYALRGKRKSTRQNRVLFRNEGFLMQLL